ERGAGRKRGEAAPPSESERGGAPRAVKNVDGEATSHPLSVDVVRETIISCERCPRLRDYCAQVAREKRRAFRDDVYWGKPVPGLAILAPAFFSLAWRPRRTAPIGPAACSRATAAVGRAIF